MRCLATSVALALALALTGCPDDVPEPTAGSPSGPTTGSPGTTGASGSEAPTEPDEPAGAERGVAPNPEAAIASLNSICYANALFRETDVDGNGEVNIDDFLLLLAAWGPCP